MTHVTTHNPDTFMFELRQILSQGRKRIGLLIGAGAPVSMTVDADNGLCDSGKPIIPDVAKLTEDVLERLDRNDLNAVEAACSDLGGSPNIEAILTRIRQLSEAIGTASIHGSNSGGYKDLSGRICAHIGKIVSPDLPDSDNPYTRLVSWIAGTSRTHAVEIFTPNYDLLLEQAFERQRSPYFDGFAGSHEPFFDPASVSDPNVLPDRWTRLWKIHGSLGWETSGDRIIRTGRKTATMLIYPSHRKYDQIVREPYSALFERLGIFLKTPDTLLICTGFSFSDAQITAVLDEALSVNPNGAVIAFQFHRLKNEVKAIELAKRRSNLSIYAPDGAVISGVEGHWRPKDPLNKEWADIRSMYWKQGSGEFLLGDFATLTRFFALNRANIDRSRSDEETDNGEREGDSTTEDQATDGNADASS